MPLTGVRDSEDFLSFLASSALTASKSLCGLVGDFIADKLLELILCIRLSVNQHDKKRRKQKDTGWADRKIKRGFYVEMYYEKSPKFLMEREIRTFAKKMNLHLSTTV